MADSCLEGGGADGGAAGDAGTARMCLTNTDNGDHCHPFVVVIPEGEVPGEGITYMLEDGGTGHTHSITLGIYDFGGLIGGGTQLFQSTEAEGHAHLCRITCPSE